MRLRSRGVSAEDGTLQDAYEHLLQENAVLRSQFEQAIPLQEHWAGCEATNKRLISELANMKSERDELAHRLGIALQANTELKHSLDDREQWTAADRETVITSHTHEIDKIKKCAKAQIDELGVNLVEARQLVEEQEVQLKLANQQQQAVLNASARFFNQKFKSLDQVIRRLEQPKIIEPETKEIEVRQDLSKSDKQVRQLETKRRLAVKQTAELQQKVNDLQRELNQTQLEAKRQNNALEQQISRLENENRIADSKHDSTVSELQRTIENLKAELTKVKAKSQQRIKEFLSKSSEFVPPAPQPREKPAKSPDLTGKVAALSDDLRRSETKKEALIEKLHETEKENHQLSLALQKRECEFESLRVIHSEAVAEIASLKSAILPKEAQPVLPKSKADRESKIASLKKALDDQTERVYALEANVSKQKGELHESERRIRQLEHEKEDLEQVIDSAKCDLRASEARRELAKFANSEIVLPPESFQLPNADPALGSALLKLGLNESLQPGSKLQTSLNLVRKHYERLFRSRDQEIDDALSDSQKLSAAFNQFLIDVSIAATGNPIRLEEFLASEAGENLVDQISRLKTDVAALRHERDSQAGILALLSQSFKGYYHDRSDPSKQILETKAALDRFAETLSTQNQKIRDLKSNLNGLKTSADKKLASLNQSISTLQKELDNTKDLLNERNRELAAAKSQIEVLNQDLIESKIGAEKNYVAVVEQNQEEVEELRRSANDTEQQLNNTLAEWQSRYTELASEKNDDERQIAALRKRLQNVQSAKERQGRDAEEYRQNTIEAQKLAAKHWQEEKQALEQAHNQVVNELRQQLTSVRNDLDNISRLRNEADESLTAAAAEKAALAKENKRAENEIKSLKGQLEREKKVAEASIQAAKNAADSLYYKRLEEQRAAAETERQRLLSIPVDFFRSFFNIANSLTERNVVILLEQVKDELSRLSGMDKAIRKMLGMSRNQTTDDGVAQLLWNKED